MITIEKWAGLITNASPYALPGGACVSQVNLQCLKPGQLQSRGGLSTAATTAGASVVVVLGRFNHPTLGDQVIYQCGTSVSLVSITA